MVTTITKMSRKVRRVIRFLLGKELIQGQQLCVSIEPHGSEYSSWAVASDILDCDSIVYSIGIGDDIIFDLSLIKRYGLKLHAFDPTPRSIEWLKKQKLPAQFLFHPTGIANFDGIATFHPPANAAFISYSLVDEYSSTHPTSIKAPVCRLGSLMNKLGHKHIDLLKMDIEGAEYGVIQDLLDQCLPIRQILVEFHHRFSSEGVQKTQEAIRSLNRAGYHIFYVSDLGEEYSFLNSSGDWPK